ncbi:hypothetical protein MCHI_002622, partial [Candidatus Magnetoovum chiemensis]
MIIELLGFDIRLNPKYYMTQLWDYERRVRHLLNPDITWPLSVDKIVWPSLFRYSSSLYEYPYFNFEQSIYIEPEEFRHSAINLWTGIEKMETYFFKHKGEIDNEPVSIGITLAGEDDFRSNDYWAAVLSPPLSIDGLPKEWLFLGYDVADQSTISSLSNCGYNDDEKK